MPFNLARPLVIVRTARSSSYLQYRTAQTARQPQDDPEPSHEASNSPSASSSSRQMPDRKGKGRADPAVDGYRFPERGRNGGVPDPFEVLALERSASQAQVKQQYYRLALILHPDSTHPSSSPAHFATLNRAYTLLSSPSSRNDYLTFGQGWGSSEGTYYDPAYAAMRAEVMRRGRARASRGVRAASAESQPGWDGGYGVDGEWYKYPNRTEQEPRYMSHRRFVGFILAGSAIIGWAQYIRVEQVNENRRMVLDASHMDASHALAAAREEARANGRARREQIRRKVNESKYLREIDKVEQEGGGTT